jgi:hypothetical protein
VSVDHFADTRAAASHRTGAPAETIQIVKPFSDDSCLQLAQPYELLVVFYEKVNRLNRLAGEAGETAPLGVGVKLDLKPHAIEEIFDAATIDCQTLLGRVSTRQIPSARVAAQARCLDSKGATFTCRRK